MKITMVVRESGAVNFSDIRPGWFTAHFTRGEIGVYYKTPEGKLFRVLEDQLMPIQIYVLPGSQLSNYTPVDVELVVTPKGGL